MFALDTETTGIDLRHGARPFFVTVCYDDGRQLFWEWDVDPLTRKVQTEKDDLEEIRQLLEDVEPQTDLARTTQQLVVLQNAKFDAAALATVIPNLKFPWGRVRDTLLAGHLLASNRPHNLTDMALQYLGVDIYPYEERLREEVLKARRLVQQAKLKVKRGREEDTGLAAWRIAEEGLEEMPSAGGKSWKYDTWLPRALARHHRLADDHPWWTVLRDYANADSAVTLCLWKVMDRLVRDRKLESIYAERLKVLPVASVMERRGITVSRARVEEKITEYRAHAAACNSTCLDLAADHGYELEMPKGASPNNSLRKFMFEVLKLPQHRGHKAKTDAPSLNKAVMEDYLATLPPGPGLDFVRSLMEKRSRDTAVAYMEAYKRFWRPWTVSNDAARQKESTGLFDDWFVLYPSLNPTGTDTLRWSSENPNEQNISKKEGFNLRYCFGPAPGREWWSLDAKNIELRLPAYEAKEQEMIGLFERPDDPPYYGSNHLLVFHVLWPELWDAALKEVGLEKVGPYCKKKYASTNYQWTKNGNFAVQYGAIDRADGTGTADRAYHKPGGHALVKAKFAKMARLNDWCIRFAEKHGYIETIPDKTVDPARGYPLLCTRTEWGKILPTVPLNYRIQGTAMWWMMKAMIRCQGLLDEWNRAEMSKIRSAAGISAPRLSYLVMQVHDELVFDLPRRADPKVNPKASNLGRIREIQRLMERGGDDLGIPTPVSCEYHGETWSEGVTL